MMWGRKISDLAFSEFINILEYKANVTKIDRFYPSCNAKHKRDVNASINIHRVGASTLAGEVVRATSVA